MLFPVEPNTLLFAYLENQLAYKVSSNLLWWWLFKHSNTLQLCCGMSCLCVVWCMFFFVCFCFLMSVKQQWTILTREQSLNA